MMRFRRALWHAISFPFRLPRRLTSYVTGLARRRISVQLILSHVLVVVLTVIAIEGALLVVRFAMLDLNENPDANLARQSDAIAAVLAQSPAANDLATSTTVSPENAFALEAALHQIVAGGLPIAQDPIDSIFVSDMHGRIVASSDPSWAPINANIDQVRNTTAVALTERAIQLNGQPTKWGNLYITDTSGLRTIVSRPIIESTGHVIGTFTLQGPPIQFQFFPIGHLVQFIRFVLANIVLLSGVSVVALAVAIPVGVWRGRAFSSRFSNLAEAADAIGRGELDRRIEISGDDELTRLASRFNEVIQQLQDVDHSRKAFIANVSHELRTPLAIIQGHIERLAHRPPVPVTAGIDRDWLPPNNLDANALETIEREIETLGSLINDLFTLARLQEAALPLDPHAFQIDELILETVESQRVLTWEQQKVALSSLVAPGLPPVLADATRVRQILRNLLFNALRHTPEGGIVVVNAMRDGPMMVVSVQDTGIGIAADEIAYVFDRFYQAEHVERDFSGSGLGLSVVKQLVEAQGGTIRVESEPGHGTTFQFTLPLATSA